MPARRSKSSCCVRSGPRPTAGDRLDRMGVFDRLKVGLSRTADQLVRRLDEIVRGADAPGQRARAVDVETIEALEDLLISADLGVPATDRILEAIRTGPRRDRSL